MGPTSFHYDSLILILNAQLISSHLPLLLLLLTGCILFLALELLCGIVEGRVLDVQHQTVSAQEHFVL